MSQNLQLLFQIFQKFLLPVIRILAFAYIGLAIVLYIGQSNLVFMPSKDVIETPEMLRIKFENIQITTRDNVNLDSWFVLAKDDDLVGKGVILFCHGNGGNISNRISYLPIFRELGLATFLFDYRGYGKSGGTPTEEGTYADVEAAWQYLTQERQIPPQKIIIYGESLGGAIASYLAQKISQPNGNNNAGGLVLASTFTSISDRAAELYPFMPIRFLSRFSYNSIERLPSIKIPVLVIHSIDDEIIPFHHGDRNFQVANQPKKLVKLRGDHNGGFLDSLETYRNGLNEFIQSI
ncbi:alpha/beta fold hydrolase [Pseudanabaena galeata UHCC 0370]|uniref:Alpha/beta fold hydrolase n=1 Tax=Pseudanabaena galeata UHCC 0370 TaxID=3110310 RepID=A0ABU5TNA5_9CYAN|nr:alpha/beta fold hydrolase [Pseudanabaena galeata]MEA5479685.1 alpha/beta fold hydrolase [Pseudanabaena galeata UHCC 0370]